MSVTKHKIFRIKISNDSNLSLNKDAQKTIDLFLADSNNIYVNHSISVLTEDIEIYGQNKTVNKIFVVSLIYKDLNDSAYDVKKASKKIQRVVSNEIELGQEVKKPEIETEFDKEIQEIIKQNEKKNESSYFDDLDTENQQTQS